jgi:hypothetical protein
MASSGTTTFQPPINDLTLNAFSRLQIQPSGLTHTHMVQLRMEANFLQAEWTAKGLTLWSVDLQSIPLLEGVATYDIPPDTIMILDAYVSTGDPPTNRYISPISRTDYGSLANPTQPGFPTSYWFNRLILPTITLWPVPDGSGPETLSYYRYHQLQDAEYKDGIVADVPYTFLDAWAAGLAHRLSRHYAPGLEMLRKADSIEAFNIASTQYVENVNMYISPGLSGYYRP